MSTQIQSLKFLPGSHPQSVELVLGDAANEDKAEIWITARFSFEGRSDDKLAVLAQEALRKLQTLVDEGIAAAQAPPG